MARPRKYVIKLTDDELKTLKSIIRKSNTSKTIRSRCQIIIDLDEAHGKVLTHEQSARSNGVCLTTANTVTKYFSVALKRLPSSKRNINSDNARRILDGRAEARIMRTCLRSCSRKVIPDGPLRLLEKEVKVVLDTPVSKDAIAEPQKNKLRPHKNEYCIPQERTIYSL